MKSNSDPRLSISEIFGPTVQGEGPSLGQRAVFLRLSGCHVGCSWCDTRYSWDVGDPSWASNDISIVDVTANVLSLGSSDDIVVVTGGEPLLQQRALTSFVEQESLCSRRLHLETSGIIEPTEQLVRHFEQIVVSPKLMNAQLPAHRRINPRALAVFAGLPHVWFKFVVQGVEDLAQVGELADRFAMKHVMVMPEGRDADTVLRTARDLADATISRGWSLTTRLHVLLWGDTPGR